MKLSISFLFLFFYSYLAIGQCYSNTNEKEPPPYYLNELKIANDEQRLIEFFNIKIEFWEFSIADRFCYQKNNIQDVKLTINQNVVHNKSLKTPIYAHLLAYYFQSELNIETEFKEQILLADALAGYFYCYQEITKNWTNIKDDLSIIIKKSKELNLVMDAYIELYNNYKIDGNNEDINIVARKAAFLKGTYYAMPPNYRMQITSTTDYGNDVALLFNEIKRNDHLKKKFTISDELIPEVTLEDLKFEIKEIKN